MITAATKNSLSPTWWAKTSTEPTRISATSAVVTVAMASATSDMRSDQPFISPALATWILECRRSEYQVTPT